MNTKIILDTKLVGNVQGVFYVPSYQRGYRWGKEEVTRLLEDIYTNGNKTYCLQPVVVRKDGDRYELIDGQQRLTTLFILLQYIKREYKPKISLKKPWRILISIFIIFIMLIKRLMSGLSLSRIALLPQMTFTVIL